MGCRRIAGFFQHHRKFSLQHFFPNLFSGSGMAKSRARGNWYGAKRSGRTPERPSRKQSIWNFNRLLGAYYDIKFLFTVSEQVFIPPPKVKSAVIRLRRNPVEKLSCNEELFFRVVKAAFNKRRKMLRNSLSELELGIPEQFAEKRPEQLSVADFIRLTQMVET